MHLIGIAIEDNNINREVLALLIHMELDAKIIQYFENNTSAIDFIEKTSVALGSIDFIITDINHPGGSGLELIKKIRSLPDSMIISGCLRVKHTPIIVVSACSMKADIQACKEIDSSIPYVTKPINKDELAQAIIESIGEYRHKILKGIQHKGLCIYWRDGKYHIGSAYESPNIIESEYIVSSPTMAAKGYERLFIVDWQHNNATVSLNGFERMINNPSLKEKDFQLFFQRHPEFLLDGNYDSYWSETNLRSKESGDHIRPDFVLQPQMSRSIPWNWNVVDLKRHDVALLTSKRFHTDLSRYVVRVITQLRNYRDFFEDPRNADILKKKFGGVVPNPKLTAIIGRLPKSGRNEYMKHRNRNPDVNIITYDEVLEVRRVKVDKMNVLREKLT